MNKYLKLSIIVSAFTMSFFLFSCKETEQMLTTVTDAQSFSKSFGSSGTEMITSSCNASDGGIILAGYTNSVGSGDFDVLVIKIDNSGNISWSFAYGGTGVDQANSIFPTTDGGYILTGNTTSGGADGNEMFTLKIDGSGNRQWSKFYRWDNDQFGTSVVETHDGYLLVGYSDLFVPGFNDIIVLHVNSSGQYVNVKHLGSDLNDFAYKIIPTQDLGFLIAGSTYGFGAPNGDALLLKLYGDYVPNWAYIYGGDGYDQLNDVIQNTSGNFLVCGLTQSFGLTHGDGFIFKTNSDGSISVSEFAPKTLGLSMNGFDQFLGIRQADNGSYFLTGFTSEGSGMLEMMIVHYYADGVFDFARTFGGASNEKGNTVLKKSDGSFIVSGFNESFSSGMQDAFSVKVKSDFSGCATQTNIGTPQGSVQTLTPLKVTPISYPANTNETVDLPMNQTPALMNTNTQCTQQ